jgi:hypothetical protein
MLIKYIFKKNLEYNILNFLEKYIENNYYISIDIILVINYQK